MNESSENGSYWFRSPRICACLEYKAFYKSRFNAMLLHDFDFARFFMKDEVESVFAIEANLVVN